MSDVEFDDYNSGLARAAQQYRNPGQNVVPSGLVAWLISKGIVKTRSAANMVLLGVAVLAAIIAIVPWFMGGGSPITSKPVPVEDYYKKYGAPVTNQYVR